MLPLPVTADCRSKYESNIFSLHFCQLNILSGIFIHGCFPVVWIAYLTSDIIMFLFRRNKNEKQETCNN